MVVDAAMTETADGYSIALHNEHLAVSSSHHRHKGRQKSQHLLTC